MLFTHQTTRAGIALLALCFASAAQTWVPLDASPPGTPAEVTFDENASTLFESRFDIRIHGFWSEDVAPGDGNVYQRIIVPGLGQRGIAGAPDVPVARLRLAVATDTSQVSLISAIDLDPHLIPGVKVYPEAIAELDEAFDPTFDPGPGSSTGTPEQFTINPLLYGGPVYPGIDGTSTAFVENLLGPVRGAIADVFPAQFDPGADTLAISGHMRVTFFASGPLNVSPPITRDRAALAAATFPNWPVQLVGYPTDMNAYRAHMLIVTPKFYENTLATFVAFKKSRGIDVNIVTTESINGGSCAKVRAAIGAWYQSKSPWDDHYALLIGDATDVELCASPTFPSVATDDLFGSPGDGDLHEEVFVGRLSVDTRDDLVAQLAKIMRYVTDDVGDHYDDATLVAHAEDAPGKYVAAQQAVANAAYTQPVNFNELYGNAPDGTNAMVVEAIEKRFGVLSYRGHGSQTTWSKWSQLGETFHKNELLGTGPAALGVVWALTCWNGDIGHGPGSVDSLGEVWMEASGSGAVAHYGSSDLSGTRANDELGLRLFEGVLDKQLVRHGQAIAWAESRMTDKHPGRDAWMYSLLGDPSMHVRSDNARSLFLITDETVDVCNTPVCRAITVRLVDAQNNPVPDALIVLYKPGPPGEPDDILITAYTDSSGGATFPNTGPSDISSPIIVLGNDPCGNDVIGLIGVVDGAWANWGGAVAGTEGFAVLDAAGTLQPMTQIDIQLDNAAQNAQAGLFVSLTSEPVGFKGGTLLAHPWTVLLELATNAQGEVVLSSQVPSSLPGGTELWFQYIIVDDEAPQGFAFSNAMRGTVP